MESGGEGEMEEEDEEGRVRAETETETDPGLKKGRENGKRRRRRRFMVGDDCFFFPVGEGRVSNFFSHLVVCREVSSG